MFRLLEEKFSHTSLTSESDALKLIRRAMRTVVAVEPSIQMEKDLEQVIEDGKMASERGYFLPDEDDRVLAAFGSYLRIRNVLYGTIVEMDKLIHRSKSTRRVCIAAYVVGVSAACLLFRAGQFLIGYKSMSVVSRKLDMGDPRLGIPRKQFTRIYYALTKTYNIYRFHKAVGFVKEHWSEVEDLEVSNPELAPVVDLLRRENPEKMFQSKRFYAMSRLGYFRYSLVRRRNSTLQVIFFKLCEMIGRTASRMRIPFRQPRATAEIRERALELLQPGDVIATRANGRMVNYCIPGYWSHVAIYLGLADERRGLGVEMDDKRWERSGPPIRVIDARKDGVMFRTLRETLSVDAFAILRPRLNREEIAEGLSRAVTHEGKAYNHDLDFTRGDRLACTELVYRSFHATGSIKFALRRRFKRVALAPDDVLDYAVDGSAFSVVALYGAKGLPFLVGKEAREALPETYQSAATRLPNPIGIDCIVGSESESGLETAENPLREAPSALS